MVKNYFLVLCVLAFIALSSSAVLASVHYSPVRSDCLTSNCADLRLEMKRSPEPSPPSPPSVPSVSGHGGGGASVSWFCKRFLNAVTVCSKKPFSYKLLWNGFRVTGTNLVFKGYDGDYLLITDKSWLRSVSGLDEGLSGSFWVGWKSVVRASDGVEYVTISPFFKLLRGGYYSYTWIRDERVGSALDLDRELLRLTFVRGVK